MRLTRKEKLSLGIICFGLFAVFLEYSHLHGRLVRLCSHLIDVGISFLFVFEVFFNFFISANKLKFLKRNLLEITLAVVFLGIFFVGKFYFFFVNDNYAHDLPVRFIVLLSCYTVVKVILRVKKLGYFLRTLSRHPAQTILFSFLSVILGGTLLLMFPFATPDGSTIGFVNALFTSTSATCVTGLIVLDTVSKFSLFGKMTILALIQIGGLGIMLLAYFTVFIMRRKVSFEEKLTLSYMLDEKDSRNLANGVKKIVAITFAFEAVGAFLLFAAFKEVKGLSIGNAFYSVFHSISAFCNAGFALFSDNLESFSSNVLLNLTIGMLIIAGGISFAVILDVFGSFKGWLRRRVLGKIAGVYKLSLNTKVVLSVTAILLVSGTLFIYRLEHGHAMLHDSIGKQYLEAFFQTVTLRTAGFNSIDMSALHRATYVLMILFMYIGGAAGSCAGGVKVNTVGVIWAYLRSMFKSNNEVVLMKHSIGKDLVNQAFFVMFLSAGVIFLGAMVLSVAEEHKVLKLLFESASAFGTVGLSTGITPDLSIVGRITLVVLMFIGRVGPLTVITALSRSAKNQAVRYPAGRISIG